MNQHQLSLFNDNSPVWANDDDWETPDNLARFIASLVQKEHQKILCPGAGRGQIEKFLTGEILAFESNYNRFLQGRTNCPHAAWDCSDFLEKIPEPSYDVAVFNPPFGRGVEFIDKSLQWLKPEDGTRCLVILPLDYLCAGGRAEKFRAMDCHIHDLYPIVGRIAFLRAGVPEGKPQRYHAVFDIRRGASSSGVSLTWI